LSVIAILFPRPVERTRDIPFLIGLVTFLFVGAIAALLARACCPCSKKGECRRRKNFPP
jgi:hypothetical protein